MANSPLNPNPNQQPFSSYPPGQRIHHAAEAIAVSARSIIRIACWLLAVAIVLGLVIGIATIGYRLLAWAIRLITAALGI